MPYLNSGIFTKQEIEKTLEINQLENGAKIQIYPATSLYDENHKKRTGEMPFLEYLFEFLDSFDFGESHSDESKSDLISSAVLGQVFERLNGYKDGSFYTPSFITSYMCRQSIDKIVLERFSLKFGTNLANLDDLEDEIRSFVRNSNDRSKAYAELNAEIDTLKICDPAVGSGYFLVSALNYIITLKSRLGILSDENGKILKAEISYEFDELKICEFDGSVFKYSRPKSADEAGQIIQKTIFNEKAKIIENCLFGVDINPNSCEIARLRLWIELLKSSYFTDFAPDPFKQNALETLPNIDINIKCGNSLVSYFDLKNKISIPKITSRINIYKNLVNAYKQSNGDKIELLNEIKNLQTLFKNYCFTTSGYEKKIKNFKNQCEIYTKQYGDYLAKDNPKLKDYVSKSFFADFDEDTAKKDYEKLLKLHDETFSLDTLTPFEWRFEFPEILDENGDFVGFDLIIANPPYIRQEAIKEQKSALKDKFKIFCGTADIYTYFFELGLNILKNDGILSFITSNKFFRASYGENLREFILKNSQIQSIMDLNGLKVFDSAIVDTAITTLKKTKSEKTAEFSFSNPKTKDFKNAEILKISKNSLNAESFTFLTPLEANLKAKIERLGTPLKDWDINIYRGVTTGLNEAFIINEQTYNEILSNCINEIEREKTKNIIKPVLRGRDIKRYYYNWDKFYIIETYPSLNLNIDEFTSLKNYLSKFLPQIEQSGAKGCRSKTGNKWFEIQANTAYYQCFNESLLVWKELGKNFAFAITKAGMACEATTSFIYCDRQIRPYLLALLLSKLIYWYILQVAADKTGTGDLRIKPQGIVKIPIPQITPKNEKLANEIINLVELILKASDESQRAELSDKIDKLVYQIYDLTADEIALIENA